MISRRNFIRSSAIAGTVGFSGADIQIFAQCINTTVKSSDNKRKNTTKAEKPVGYFSDVSIDNVKDTPILREGYLKKTPFLDRFKGIHPRIFFTSSDLVMMRKRLENQRVRRFYSPPGILSRKAPAFREGSRNGGEFKDLGSYVLDFLLRPDDRKRESLLEWMEMATTYPHCGTDLDAEYFMEGVALTYDWLYEYIPVELRNRIRETIARQCREVYKASLVDRTGGGGHFQQNHFWYAHLSLALGASAVYGEVPEADQWLPWAWDRYERIALTFSPDGGFHEGPGYWDYSMPALYMYTDLYEWISGVHVFYADTGLKGQAQFRFHHLYPGLELTAALEDTGTRAGRPPVRTFLWEARRFKDPLTMGMAELLNREPDGNCWNLLWLDEQLESRDPLKILPLAKHYPDIETVFARTGWDENATFIAFVCRPLGGHFLADLCPKFKMGGTGHNHPGQNHFILFGRGEVLAADPGYTYEKKTRNHNTILVNGQGQYGDGEMWPRPNPGRSKITHFVTGGGMTIVTGVATSAYPKELNLKLFERTVVLAGPDLVVIFDRILTEKPADLSWLIHHYGDIADGSNGIWTITRNNAQLDLMIPLQEHFKAEISTYRPQYIHPERNLTPVNADINLLELKKQQVTDANIVIPLFVGNKGNKPPVIESFYSQGCTGLKTEDLLIAFNTCDDKMTVPSGRSFRTRARALIARVKDRKYQVVLMSDH